MSNLIGSLVSVLSIIGKWKIFEDNGQEGWKAIVPFYSSYIFSKTFNEERLGKILAWSEATFVIALIPLMIILFIPFVLATFLTVVGGFGIISDTSIWKDTFNALPASGRIAVIILAAVVMISFIIMMIFHIRLHYRYTLYQNVSMWFMIVWVLMPSIGYIYFAFRQRQTDIL